MIKVWRRPADNRVYIYNVTEGPADSFEASASNGKISIARKYIGIVEVAGIEFHEIQDGAGNTFDSLEATMEYLHRAFAPGIPELASAIEKDFTCAEQIPALRLVYASADDERISIADRSDFETSLVIGMTAQAGELGDRVKVRLFGKLDDASFGFPVNEILFLDHLGKVTATPPDPNGSGTATVIGYSLGSGSIFIKAEKPLLISN